MGRARKSSVGQIDLGDSQGSSITTAALNNETRSRRLGKPPQFDESPEKKDIRQKKQKSASKGVAGRAIVTSSWLIPLIIIASVYTLQYVVAADNPDHWIRWFTTLSYNIPGTSKYGKGHKDWLFFGFYVIFFTFLREFCMQVALKPLAAVLGLRTKHKINRFLEQAYSMIYYGITGPVGLYIMKYRVPELWYFNTDAFYTGFPHMELDIWMKAFYLLQAAFWGQQAIVLLLMLEKPRRDFKELVFHHIVTVALIFCSYRFHFTYMGLAIYITMDVSDFFLALSKILNYLQSPAVGFFYGVFVFMWIYLRHYLNLVVLYSVATTFRTIGPYTLNWETQQYKCWLSQLITFTLLTLLQLVNLYWLALILRIGWRYLKDNVKEDVRSEAEDSDDDE